MQEVSLNGVQIWKFVPRIRQLSILVVWVGPPKPTFPGSPDLALRSLSQPLNLGESPTVVSPLPSSIPPSNLSHSTVSHNTYHRSSLAHSEPTAITALLSSLCLSTSKLKLTLLNAWLPSSTNSSTLDVVTKLNALHPILQATTDGITSKVRAMDTKTSLSLLHIDEMVSNIKSQQGRAQKSLEHISASVSDAAALHVAQVSLTPAYDLFQPTHSTYSQNATESNPQILAQYFDYLNFANTYHAVQLHQQQQQQQAAADANGMGGMQDANMHHSAAAPTPA
ncbi:hypothetical protein ONZ45_g9338 [Pleurotus djamor]|nr:hypothetical protein ONZ45_g9338 [Pleurotus djamor]